MGKYYLKSWFICYISNKIFTEGIKMKIQRGKVAILLVVLVMVVPGGIMSAFSIRETAMNACTASPPSDPLKLDDFNASVDLNWSTLSWVCQREYTNEEGEPNGIAQTVTFPLIP
jgi:hypothetical protein